MVKKISKIVNIIKTKSLISKIKLKLWLKKDHSNLSDIEKENEMCTIIHGYDFDCVHPRSFNEKIVWLKHFYHNDLWCKCADKLGSKEFIKSIGLEKYVPKTYAIYNSVDEIDLDKLPDKFMLKTNHDCGGVYLCEKGKTDFKTVFEKLQTNLNRKYSKNNDEWVYDNIEPKIFAEEVLIPEKFDDLIDYKFFCYNGEPKHLFVATNRNVDTNFTFFDSDFNVLPVHYIYRKPSKKNIPTKPKCYSEMLDIVKKISSYFTFIRVDMYATKDGPRVGELTFFSQSGYGKIYPSKWDFEFGKYFDECKFDFNKN